MWRGEAAALEKAKSQRNTEREMENLSRAEQMKLVPFFSAHISWLCNELKFGW
jgi:hypothetical protein